MPKIVALTNGSPHAWIILNAVVERFGPITVLAEKKAPRGELIRLRLKRRGVFMLVGQIGFVLLQRVIARGSRRRIRAIIAERELDPNPNPTCEIIPIGSVNSPACLEALARIRPDVILVYGTRLIQKETLQAIQTPVLNLHSGITPKYRGQAGAYWAMAQADPDHAGVTVHIVDEGVDTGAVISQARILPTKRDNYSTYAYIQAAIFRPLAVKAVEDALKGDLKPFSPDLPSAQYYHPTLWGYLGTGLSKGVW